MAQSIQWGHVECSQFTGQAQSSKRLTSIMHILSQKLTTALLESGEGRE